VDLEILSHGARVYAYFLSRECSPSETTFVTPDDSLQQLGFVVHPSGSEVKRHFHVPVTREITGTPEILIVRSGRCEVTLYDDAHEQFAVRELGVGDIMLIVGGGHRLEMLEDTVLVEVKQGPYLGPSEKQYF
jgi:hypothetical protein